MVVNKHRVIVSEAGIPFVNIIKNLIYLSSAMCKNKILLNPGDQVILEYALDKLV
jgi:hypothetical protein